VLLSETALDALDEGFDAIADEVEARKAAVRQCMDKLPDAWRRLVHMRYWDKTPVAHMADALKKSANSVSVTLNRIRARLADCIARRVEGLVRP
jgi:RNA polymerase sigma-70 factor (ECF subfamily)